jgi:hypothetical protein
MSKKEEEAFMAVMRLSYDARLRLVRDAKGLEMLRDFYKVGGECVVCAIITELIGFHSASRAVHGDSPSV